MSDRDESQYRDALGNVTGPGHSGDANKMSAITKHTGHLVVAQEWTTEKPTVPGWYWWKDDTHKDKCVELWMDRRDGRLHVIGVGPVSVPVSYCNGEWFGPIAPPTEATAQAGKWQVDEDTSIQMMFEGEWAQVLSVSRTSWVAKDDKGKTARFRNETRNIASQVVGLLNASTDEPAQAWYKAEEVEAMIAELSRDISTSFINCDEINAYRLACEHITACLRGTK